MNTWSINILGNGSPVDFQMQSSGLNVGDFIKYLGNRYIVTSAENLHGGGGNASVVLVPNA